MARVSGKNGALTVPTHNADWASWSLETTHPVDDDTNYGTAGNGSSHNGSGTSDYALNAAGFLKSNVASSAPVMDAPVLAGGSFTATAHTGCTEAMTAIVQSLHISHAKRSGAIPISVSAINSGNLTETWAIS